MNGFTEELGSIFADALAEIVSKMSGVPLEALPPEPDSDFCGSVALMSLSGKNNGTVFISASDETMRVVCSAMLGVKKENVTKEDIDDALGELVNMTAGNVKLRLGNTPYTFTLSTPFVINGENMSIVTKKRLGLTSRLLGNGEISIKLKVIYEPGA